MRHKWLLSAIILALLITANASRWDTVATKTIDEGVVKWSIDRWSGNYWVELYEASGVIKVPSSKDNRQAIIDNANLLKNIWFIATSITSLWLILSLSGLPRRKPKPTETNHQAP